MGTNPPKEENASEIGACTDDPRFHRRPLYPSADRSIFFEKIAPEKASLIAFRPNAGYARNPRKSTADYTDFTDGVRRATDKEPKGLFLAFQYPCPSVLSVVKNLC
ncbi:MAG: hypothetical protein Q7J98_14265, partial [Kiritimatiellia bacterium]|nr:hypothetical protein [Kiritimatiellia bacterium]